MKKLMCVLYPRLSALSTIAFKLLLALFAPYDCVCASAVTLRSVLGPSSVGIYRNNLLYFSHLLITPTVIAVVYNFATSIHLFNIKSS